MLTIKQLTAGFKTVAANRDKMNAKLQEMAVSIIGHVHEHGDTTLADRLLTAMGRGLDRQAMVAYLEEYGCVRFEKDSGRFAINKKKRSEMEFDEEYLMGEECMQWFEFAKSKKALASSFDLEARTESLLKSLAKKREEGDVEIKHGDFESFLKNALEAYRSSVA